MAKQTLIRDKDSINVNVSVILFKEEEYYVAYCPSLELSSYGDSEKDAKEGFEEAMKIFLDDTSAKGTLEKVLLKLGWQLQQKPRPEYKPPTFSLKESQKFLQKNGKVYDERVAMPV